MAYDWQLFIISVSTSAVLTLAGIAYLIDLTVYIRICGMSPVFNTFIPFISSIIILIGFVIIISLTLGDKLRPKLMLIISLAVGVLLGMLLAIFGSCL
jgi:hypothetical protein